VEWFGDFTLEAVIRVIPPGGPTMVPEVTEMTRAAAANEIRAAGLVPAFTGASGPNTYVGSQSPRAGVVVDRGTTVTCRMLTGPIP
jgi:beta-lactam-binding protein with PASTA domain